MLLINILLLIIISIFKSKSKFVANVLLSILALTAIYNTNLPDMSIYESRFNFYQQMSSYSEFGFTQLIHFFHLLGIDFFWFRAFIIVAYLLTIRWFVLKHTQHCAFVISLYAIFSYCLDVVQLRNSLAMIFVIYGIDALITDKSKYTVLKFVLAIIVATSMHFSSIFYIVLLATRYFSIAKTWIVFAWSTAIMSILFLSKDWLMKIFTLVISQDRIYMILDFASRYQFSRVVNFQLGTIFCSLLIFFLLFLSRNVIKKASNTTNQGFACIDCIAKCQILSLIAIPLLFVSVDMYRIPRNMLWLGYVGFIPNMINVKNVNQITESMFNKLLMLGVALVIFLIQIYGMGNFNDVFIPLFFN